MDRCERDFLQQPQPFSAYCIFECAETCNVAVWAGEARNETAARVGFVSAMAFAEAPLRS
jgi:hypothetical protein